MGTISSGVGLVSGLKTADIIDQLMALARRPVRLLESRVTGLTQQQTALLSVSALLLTLKNLSERFGQSAAFDLRRAASSNPDVLAVSASAGAPVGAFTFTVSRLVQTHQMISAGFADTDRALVGEGTIRIELGQGFLATDTPLSFLNAQAGIDRGSIRVTDRSGASAVIDLSDAVTVGDVLERINGHQTVDVTATVSGDHLVITDNTGQTASNLIVANVGADATATSLGIAASVAAGQITGTDLVSLAPGVALGVLNDQNGVRHQVGFDDFRITQRDGSTIDVNISGATTLAGVLEAINSDEENTGDLVAQLAADGVSIELVDASVGETALAVTALNGSDAAADLGLLKTVTGGGDTLRGDRLVAGLNTVLLRSLNGGRGVAVGEVRIVDRAGTESIVDLSSAQTVQDVVDLINDAAVAANVTAALNRAGNGLLVTDHTGSTSAPLIVTNHNGSTTATDLGLDTTDAGVAASAVNGSDLDLRYISEATLLETLNGGRGIAPGKFTIMDSTGAIATVDLTQGNETTIGHVIQEINSRPISVVASINATGDGILLTDTGGGAGRLTVLEVGTGRTAADLGILGTAAEGETTIDGAFEYELAVGPNATLSDLVTAINSAGLPLKAAIINDGSSGMPYRLSLVSEYSGRGGRLLIDTGATDLSLTTLVQGRDAVLAFGTTAAGAEPLIITSHSNTITNAIQGVTLDLLSVSPAPVTVSIATDQETLVSRVQEWVTAINAVLGGIADLTAYNADTQTLGVLQGDPTVNRIRSRLYDLVTRAYQTGGTFTALRQLGIRVAETGRLSLDTDRLREALANDLSDVTALFATASEGVSALFADTLASYTEGTSGLIDRRVASLSDRIDLLTRQTERYEVRLAAERRRLELQFAQMEVALLALQDQQRAIANFQSVAIFGQ